MPQSLPWKRCLTLSARTAIQIAFYIFERCSDLVDWVNDRFSGMAMQREFIRVGQCRTTGQCCRAIGLEFPQSWVGKKRLIHWLTRWHALRYNFEQVGLEENLLIYECGYLRPDNRCGIHRFKPKLCRDFPQRPWTGKIRLHKGCGYRYISRQAREFEIILHRKTSRD